MLDFTYLERVGRKVRLRLLSAVRVPFGYTQGMRLYLYPDMKNRRCIVFPYNLRRSYYEFVVDLDDNSSLSRLIKGLADANLRSKFTSIRKKGKKITLKQIVDLNTSRNISNEDDLKRFFDEFSIQNPVEIRRINRLVDRNPNVFEPLIAEMTVYEVILDNFWRVSIPLRDKIFEKQRKVIEYADLDTNRILLLFPEEEYELIKISLKTKDNKYTTYEILEILGDLGFKVEALLEIIESDKETKKLNLILSLSKHIAKYKEIMAEVENVLIKNEDILDFKIRF
jgi:hypothetical protein